MKPSVFNASWVTWIGLGAYFLLLLALAEDFGFDAAIVAPSSIQSAADIGALVWRLILAFSIQVVAFLPLGFLAALALGRRELWFERVLRLWIPALALSFALAACVRAFELKALSPLSLVTPALGCALGVVIGVARTRGPGAWSRFLRWAAAFAIAALFAAGALVTFALDRVPLAFEPTPVTSTDKRSVYRQLEGRDPRKVPEGKTERLVLTPRDLNVLLAWGLWASQPTRKVHLELEENHVGLSVSGRLAPERYLNVVGEASCGVAEGRLRLRVDRLSVGRVDVPSLLLRAASPMVATVLAADRRTGPLLSAIRTLTLQPSGAEIVYGRAELPKGFVADLFHGEGTGSADLEVVEAHLQHLLGRSGTLPRGDERLGAIVEAAFDYARTRSKEGRAIEENRGAVLAIGILVGHWRVQGLVGPILDEHRLRAAARAFKGSTLRGRSDWPKHFFVSASLTVLARGSISDMVGLLKEELDADGGSGFSFGDLLADRAGTTFAQEATRDEASARALQERLARRFRVDDFFPPGADLPEGLTDAEFQAGYGGVGGAGYNRLVEEIERRVSRCAAYRAH